MTDNAPLTGSNQTKQSTNNQSTSGALKQSLKKRIPKPVTRLAKPVTTQLNRAQVLKGMTTTMVNGYRAITKIDGWGDEPKRDKVLRYNKIFCGKMASAFNVEVVEVEPMPDTQGLWAGNHVSWMDIPVMGSVVPAFFLSKAEVEAMPAFGRLARACGSLFIKRGSGDSGKVSGQITEFLKKGYSVLFYPEGTTTDGTQIKSLYGKLLQAAIDADKPVQPVVICYVNDKGEMDDKIPFVGDTTFVQSFLTVMDSNPVTAYILPLEPLSSTGKTRDELTQELQQHMQQGLDSLKQRVLTQSSAKTSA
ncbi:lysophospholipid acyltransferase family protein [Psychrobacter sp. FDAARGOS_221]|uniref:lysophospholipid acyltransferase family protein n=1 Tax=Psychrobacter sp. FDAARGOS_221 TaxID=1975705 RepID=UPI000BB56B90|nr:lysophospholipid acyltransferase family protein [Psychrobacter sp. FDAARGOS_221]PNK61294.1 1-acyl-sn-glycerol-3-phosphate acyltransferase [Psychrobacter sp. FDAARGOS_221]